MSIKIKNTAMWTVKILIGLIIIAPIILTLIFSFQSNSEINNPPMRLFTAHPTLENYRYALSTYNILKLLGNTFLVIMVALPVSTVISAMCAYAFAHFNFPFKNGLFAIFLAVMMIPGETTIISNYLTIQQLGLIDTYLGIMITGFVNIGGMFMLRQHMMSLPSALWDAAKVDGCGHTRYFTSVALPLSKPIIVTLVLNSFIGAYNDYFWPLLVILDDKKDTMAIGVAKMLGDSNLTPGYTFAGGVVSMVIPIIIYILGVDRIVEGMTAGAVKS